MFRIHVDIPIIVSDLLKSLVSIFEPLFLLFLFIHWLLLAASAKNIFLISFLFFLFLSFHFGYLFPTVLLDVSSGPPDLDIICKVYLFDVCIECLSISNILPKLLVYGVIGFVVVFNVGVKQVPNLRLMSIESSVLINHGLTSVHRLHIMITLSGYTLGCSTSHKLLLICKT